MDGSGLELGRGQRRWTDGKKYEERRVESRGGGPSVDLGRTKKETKRLSERRRTVQERYKLRPHSTRQKCGQGRRSATRGTPTLCVGKQKGKGCRSQVGFMTCP